MVLRRAVLPGPDANAIAIAPNPIGIEAAALQFGLHFVPLLEETMRGWRIRR